MQDAEKLENTLAAQSPAPRVSLKEVQDNIVGEYYFVAHDAILAGDQSVAWANADKLPDPLKRLTFCVLVLKNGFTVTGQSACVSAANYDPKIGEEIAYKNAFEQIWPLMGYALADRLAWIEAWVKQYKMTPNDEAEFKRLYLNRWPSEAEAGVAPSERSEDEGAGSPPTASGK